MRIVHTTCAYPVPSPSLSLPPPPLFLSFFFFFFSFSPFLAEITRIGEKGEGCNEGRRGLVERRPWRPSKRGVRERERETRGSREGIATRGIEGDGMVSERELSMACAHEVSPRAILRYKSKATSFGCNTRGSIDAHPGVLSVARHSLLARSYRGILISDFFPIFFFSYGGDSFFSFSFFFFFFLLPLLLFFFFFSLESRIVGS